MPKLIPVPDDLSKPFWDAVNTKKLVLQHCDACNKLQYPPQKTCQVCGYASDRLLRLDPRGCAGSGTADGSAISMV